MSDDQDFSQEWRETILKTLCQRPPGLTEVRRDGKDDNAVALVIREELRRLIEDDEGKKKKSRIARKMHIYSRACWNTMEALHLLMLDDEQPENEKARLDPDHWYENNLTNALLFANLTLEGLPQLVPGRLFTTRMPRNIVEDPQERQDFIDKCKKNNLKVVCCLTETDEFKKYSGMDNLLDFYKEECGLIVYNRAIPDFDIPTSGDLVNNILDLTHHLSQGENCLVHCAGGSGRTGMVIAAIYKNLGVYDYVARIRRVKSTYVETYEQELFLRNFPKVIDSRIVRDSPLLAKAIAAEHLLQVFHTHGEDLEKSKTRTDDIEPLDEKEENELKGAFLQVFDLVDEDKSGTLSQKELMEWMTMCGAEFDVSPVIEVLLREGEMSRDKFAMLMCSSAAGSRRAYDIGGNIGGGHH